MAPAIEAANCSFDYIVVSPAQRAQQTIEGVASLINFDDWFTEENLYTFDWQQLEQCVIELADVHDEALLVGHNPAITEFCNYKSDANIDNVPTCGFARIQFEVESWNDIGSSKGQLLDFIAPKMLLRRS